MATTAQAAEASPSAYEGGAGGKLRSTRRPHRHRPSTPYDRPPTVFRNPNNTTPRNGWISRLVDPASRIITNSASRLFSSVFRKRLTAPPSASETKFEAGHGQPEENPLVVEEQRRKDGENVSNNHDSNVIDELEQLLKQKTFTRVEFDHLTELLRSRTVDVPMEVEDTRTEPSTSKQVITYKMQEKPTTTGLENGEGRLLLGNISTNDTVLNVGKQILREDALPTELAKAYMGSRISKVSPSSLGTSGHKIKQDPTSLNIVAYASKSPSLSSTSRSARHSSGVPGLTDPWSTAPRPRGRSALYSMSRVPYSGIGSATTIKGIKSNNNYGYIVPSTSSDWTQGNNSSGVQQALKRSSSTLGDDSGSGGPMRRIRQKHNTVSPLKDEVPISSIRRPILSEGLKYDTSNILATENGYKHITNTNVPSVPLQSTEMARKILQQLDKLVPSPKEKSSEQKYTLNREKSPAKLTLNMLSGRALKSMEDTESIKLPDKDTPNAMFNGLNGSYFLDANNSISQKQDGLIDNGPPRTAAVDVKLGPEVQAVRNADLLVENTQSGSKPADSFVSGFDANSRVKRAFQICAPEDYVDVDDDSCSGKDVSVPQPADEKHMHSVVEKDAIVTEIVTIDKPLISATGSKPIASSQVQNGVEDITGAFDGPVINAKDAAPAISPVPTTTNAISMTHSSPCPLPAVQFPSKFNGSVLQKLESANQMVNFASKCAGKAPSIFSSSSMSCSFSNSPGHEEDTKPASILEKISSNASSISVEGAGSDKGNKSLPEGDMLPSLQSPPPSGMLTSATSTIFSFGASTNSGLSNGSLSSTISMSAVPSSPIFGNSSSSMSSSSSASVTSSSVITTSLSAPLPSFTVSPLFNFGSGTMAAASPTTASQPSMASGLESVEAEPKSKQALSLNMPSSSSMSSAGFSSAGNGIFSFNASTSAGATNLSFASSQGQSTGFGDSTTRSVFACTQANPAVSSVTPFTQSASSQFGSSSSSSSFVLGGSAFNFGSSSFGSSAPGSKSFGLASGFGLGSSTSPSLGVGSLGSGCGSFTPSGMASSFLGSSCQSANESISGSGFVSASSSLAAPGFSFGASASATSTGGAAGFSFGALGPSTSTGSMPGFSFEASAPATSSGGTTGFSFGASAPATSSSSTPGFSFQASVPAASSGSSTPLPFGSSFGASSGSMFPFTSVAPGAITSTSTFTPQPGFGSASAGNDQMNEDSMAEDTVQASAATMASPVFGQPVANSAPPSNFSFGSPAVTPSGGVFQFGSHQSPQAPSPFSSTATLPGAGGSFSLGAVGSDKANRRIVKIRRDKLARKK